MRTLWPWAILPTEEQITSSLNGKIAHWERHGFGMWLLRERATGQFVGRGGPAVHRRAGVAVGRGRGGRSCPSAGARGSPPSWPIASVDAVFTDLQACAT